MSDNDREARAARIADTVLGHELARGAVAAGRGIAVYEALEAEPPTRTLIGRLRDAGSKVLVPRVLPHRQLAWVRLGEAGGAIVEAAAVGAAGLRRHDCALVITPALAVGRDGTRLGQGGGYFDRLIAETRDRVEPGDIGSPPVFLALVGPDEVVEAVPTDGLDQPIDGWIVG